MPNPIPNRIDSKDIISLNTFGFISANLYNFLPNMPYHTHRALYRDFRTHQWLHGMDANFFKGQYPLPIEGANDFLAKITSRSGIVCTFHFGVYQLICHLFLKSETRFALLVGAEVYKNWRARYPALMEQLDAAALRGNFVLLDANSSTSLRQMYTLVKTGYNLIVYVDGIQGLAEENEKHLIPITFLGQQIFVPKGAASLSHMINAPMYPMLALRRTDKIEVISAPPIIPSKSIHKSDYCTFAMTKIFSLLSSHVMHWPEQWSNWPLLHYFLRSNKPIGRMVIPGELSEEMEYSLFRLDGKGFLLKKANYKAFYLKESDFQVVFDRWSP